MNHESPIDIAILKSFKSNCPHAAENRATAAQRRFGASLFVPLLVGTSCSGGDDSTPPRAKCEGRVTIVYQDDAIQPENRDAIKKIRDSGVFERMADRLTKAVALPHDLEVIVTDKDIGPNAALGGAVLFDAMGSKRPNLTLEDFSSDHPVILQRVYNFLCAVVGSDPQRLQNSLVTDGYIPQGRAMLCRKEWTQLNYGWWAVLEPHLTEGYKKEAHVERQQARKDLEDEKQLLPAKIRQVRGGGQ